MTYSKNEANEKIKQNNNSKKKKKGHAPTAWMTSIVVRIKALVNLSDKY